MLKALLVFMLVTFYDFSKTRYIFHISRKDVYRAALYSSITSFISSIVILSFITDYKMIVPAAAGAFLGTFVSMKFIKNT